MLRRSTLVHVIAENNCISFRTVSRSRKSPHRFYILRKDLEDLKKKPEVIARDIHSFAAMRRDIHADIIEIEFTWLDGDGHSVSGYQETVTIPYGDFAAFVRDSAFEDGPKELKTLSMDTSRKHPELVFKSSENLHAAIRDRIIRRRLVCCLRDQFNWPQSDKIEFYNDFMPYSFVFHEIKNGKTVMTGGLILHRETDTGKVYYGIHT